MLTIVMETMCGEYIAASWFNVKVTHTCQIS